MSKSIDTYDLGDFNLEEYVSKLNIDALVKSVEKDFKETLLKSEIDLLGLNLELTTSKTNFNGKRVWFKCPLCAKRVGILYRHPTSNNIGCRKCLNLKYKKQRFKGMIEGE